MESGDIVTGRENEGSNSLIYRIWFISKGLTRTQVDRGMDEQLKKNIPYCVLQKEKREEGMAQYLYCYNC